MRGPDSYGVRGLTVFAVLAVLAGRLQRDAEAEREGRPRAVHGGGDGAARVADATDDGQRDGAELEASVHEQATDEHAPRLADQEGAAEGRADDACVRGVPIAFEACTADARADAARDPPVADGSTKEQRGAPAEAIVAHVAEVGAHASAREIHAEAQAHARAEIDERFDLTAADHVRGAAGAAEGSVEHQARAGDAADGAGRRRRGREAGVDHATGDVADRLGCDGGEDGRGVARRTQAELGPARGDELGDREREQARSGDARGAFEIDAARGELAGDAVVDLEQRGVARARRADAGGAEGVDVDRLDRELDADDAAYRRSVDLEAGVQIDLERDALERLGVQARERKRRDREEREEREGCVVSPARAAPRR